MKHSDLTDRIIRAFYRVYNTLGYGFLESVYEAALALELHENGVRVERQKPIDVYYRGIPVGKYFADILVEDRIVLELKTCEGIHEAHLAQLTNYLRATGCEVGLLLNFGPKPQVKRRVFDAPVKTNSSGKSVSIQ